jgi:type I restriction enzyme R subunit
MTQDETRRVKLAAKSLLQRLLVDQPKVLVQDWYKDQQSQIRVRSAVQQVLNDNLPDSYDRLLFQNKCHHVYDVILDYASRGVKWAA